MNDQLIKAAVEVGRRKALYETTNKLRDELERRLKRTGVPKPPPSDAVGWRETPLGKPATVS